ncbi:hypothetical protein RB2654_15080 [Rhodobacterales bacterium HTCC2654]|uniref:Uncharacterized protein n=1 Tax=Maritimibacter alkaliphilus HTCC2654 TaxID=314271 RepID=A3VH65_9RHOB|nr:hypothetical protein RB2654_15080 [Rhodobacterales bacterium HTCC2654] [Maritimibacter alkaliphilus HTCC2654]
MGSPSDPRSTQWRPSGPIPRPSCRQSRPARRSTCR